MTGEGKELLETVINTLGDQIALQMELKFAITQRVLEMVQENSATYGVSFWTRPDDPDNPKAGVLLRATPQGFTAKGTNEFYAESEFHIRETDPKEAASVLLTWTLQKHLEHWVNYHLTCHDEETYRWQWDC
ncbi:MAG: hypothetical protein KGD60_15140 [Candidatus Thorarchaeota archaeon]|nr:hypothetical protein [Candidatus Thorarchaeota archaeon]